MLNNEIKAAFLNKIKLINKLVYLEDRVQKTIELKEEIYSLINEEIDELLSIINLKKNKDE